MEGSEKRVLNVPRYFFWDQDYPRIDWENHYVSIIDRVLERGSYEHWEVLIDFYGRDRVVKTVVEEIGYMRDDVIDDVCTYFDLEKGSLKSYKRKQTMPRTWL